MNRKDRQRALNDKQRKSWGESMGALERLENGPRGLLGHWVEGFASVLSAGRVTRGRKRPSRWSALGCVLNRCIKAGRRVKVRRR